VAAGAAVVASTALYLNNASWIARPEGELTLVSHRGVHQPFSRDGLTMQSCTAAKSLPVDHTFIENTLPSIRRAFELGAHVVEIDVLPSRDGEFVLFHDWTLDCRTDGRGPSRERTLAELKALDIGYGYTRDGGRTYPLRGAGMGLMPTLEETLRAFPGRRFLVNVKSNDRREADLLHAYLANSPGAEPERLAFYGGWRPMQRLRELRPGVRTMDKGQAKRCLKSYMLTGWAGRTPSACRATLVYVPTDYGWLLWGWPNRFLARMQSVGTEVYAGGRTDFELQSIEGLDRPEQLTRLPRDWKGGVITDRIEVIGPAVTKRARR
jgi:glycerophosphoryl diester phosphodiesterase